MTPARILLPCLVFVMTHANAETSLSENVVANIERLIGQQRVRAAVVGVYEGGNIQLASLGSVNDSSDAPPDGGTVFEIGSVSKVFTALLAQTQVDKGRLDWDEPISKYLAGVRFQSELVANISLRQLATHTSGLPPLPDNMVVDNPLDPYENYHRQDLLAFLSSYKPSSLQKVYAYSNLGAGLLGEIASRAAGANYRTAMLNEVLHPLGMRDSMAGISPRITDRLATGFSDGATMPNWSGFDAMAGAGAIMSTVDDLLRFVEQNLELRALSGPLAAIKAPQARGETALGWHIQNLADDDAVYWHNGGTGGYASFLAIRPATDQGVVILTASTEYAAVTDLGFFQISGATGEVPTITANLNATKYSQIELDESLAAEYAGKFEIAPAAILTVLTLGNQVYAQLSGQMAFPVFPYDEDRFFYKVVDAQLEFERNDSKVTAVVLHQNGKQRAKKMD